jgi:hypothetical protein
MFTPNRIVALLTPIFAGLAGWVAQVIADNFPGAPALDQGELTAIFIAGATAATIAAREWLIGWRQHEQSEALLEAVPDGS